MAVRTDFAAGEVLAAQDLDDTFAAKVSYALPTNPQTGSGASAYTFALADGLRLTTASNASAGTYTIPPQASVTWLVNSVIRIVNYGAGIVTIAGGAGVTVTNATKTLAQYESAALIRTASNAWTLVPFSGAVSALTAANVTATTGSPTIVTSGGFTTYSFTATGSITFDAIGLANIAVVGGGGGGGAGSSNNPANGAGGGGVQYMEGLPFAVGTFVVAVGGGGSGGASDSGANGSSGSTSYIAGHVGVLGGGFGGGGTNTGGSLATGGGRSGVGLNGWGFGASAASRSGGGGAGVA